MLVNCDASQLEWRSAVCLSMDPTGIEEINEGLDFHTLNQHTFGLPSRLIAKIYLFRTIFRGPAWAFANDPDFSRTSASVDFWQGVEDKFYKKYKGLDDWHKRLYKQMSTKGYVETPSGRKYYIPLKKNGDLDISAITNYPVQGFSADLVMLARLSFFRRVKELKLKSLIVNTVHDSILMDCPDDEVETVAQEFRRAFKMVTPNCKRFFGFDLAVPIECEVKIGRDYLNMKEYNG